MPIHFRASRHLARQSRCRVRIRKSGLRCSNVSGGVAFHGFVFVCCSFIFFIIYLTLDIEGTRRISQHKIRNLAAEQGLKPGNFRYQVDRDQLVNHLLRELPEISYAEVEVGPRSRIRIVERLRAPKGQGNCHIVAKKDGIIDTVLALAGQPMVKEGDMVKKGQIIISGAIYPPDLIPTTNSRLPTTGELCPGSGVVYARIWYRFWRS